jgi:RNA polymerase sigma factor (sigma-70 family)
MDVTFLRAATYIDGMQMSEDMQLLRDYVTQNSEDAFASLVARHINLVYSAALRHVNNADQARDISQTVFLILARKASTLAGGVVLSGWLYQTARLTAANFVRNEMRRRQREEEAQMESTSNTPDDDPWPQIRPLLDEAMEQLGEKDRNAIVLRFFEGKAMK